MPKGKEEIENAIKSIGQTLIDKAEEITSDLKYVRNMEIKARIEPDEIVNFDIKKNYFAPMYIKEREGK